MQQEFRHNRLLLRRERQYTALKKQKEYDIISSEIPRLISQDRIGRESLWTRYVSEYVTTRLQI